MWWLVSACVCLAAMHDAVCLNEAGWMTVARCQSGCVRKFLEAPATDVACSEHADCTMCWRMCEKLYTSHEAWSYVCDTHNDFICPPGCRAACNFTELRDKDALTTPATLTFRKTPVFDAVGHSQLIIEWTSPVSRSGRSPDFLVYALFWIHHDNPEWTYLCSTSERQAKVEGTHYLFKDVVFKLIAVVSEGAVAVTTPVYPPPWYKPPVDIANYYEDGSTYDYENYEDLPIRPESPTDQKSSPTKSSDPATSAQLGAPDDATSVPDLKTVVSVEVMNTSVQAMVIWTQPMDIRPTSYKVQWNRVTCQVDESVLPPCGLRSQQYDTSIKATVEKFMRFRLTSLTFNSEYWLEVSIDGLITQRTNFHTPRCNTTVDSTFSQCSMPSDIDSDGTSPSDETSPSNGTNPPSTVSIPAAKTDTGPNSGAMTVYITIAFCATVALLAVVFGIVVLKKHSALQQTFVATAQLIRSRATSLCTSLKRLGSHNTRTTDPAPSTVIGVVEADIVCEKPVMVQDVQYDTGSITEPGELARCLSEIHIADSVVRMDLTDSETEDVTESVCRERDTAIVRDDDGSCHIVMCDHVTFDSIDV